MRLTRKTVVIATRNAGKAKEFARFFATLGLEVRSLLDYSGLPEVVEDGATFAENALKKAVTIAERLGEPVLADDSGLCVDALNGEPGVYSARYAGEKAADADNNAKLLRELRRLGFQAATAASPDGGAGSGDAAEHPPALSPARFVCALALFDPGSGETLQVEGARQGVILAEPRGGYGFGYDPLFYLPAYGKTMAELDVDEKNRISHRAIALEKLMSLLEKKG